jgi:hypothetical protein
MSNTSDALTTNINVNSDDAGDTPDGSGTTIVVINSDGTTSAD